MSIATLLAGAAGRARTTINPMALIARVDAGETRTIINSARGDVLKALGTSRGPAFMSEMHAASLNMRSGAASTKGVTDMLAGFRELETAARHTSTRRIVGAAGILGGTITGATLLAAGRRGADQ
jgi:hypothetical protein